ncbi:DUF4194 domain-containing protein [Streptomyces collinus]|uniref:DUF4194 domain-containing protein n=1 Tax=Streptomyces collinus TaxID=42684 RepID=A0AA89QT36_STRCU|nr:DUF4194 domain-containing protein [Streptomyces collinus]MBB5816934.1 hypothetical protein [Streptomyces collinus]WMX61840.1 DUF4194 domain-containing protein [Streptomyces collinus]
MSDTLTVPVVNLLKAGVLYQSDAPGVWDQILAHQAAIGDYLAVLGLHLVIDPAEGYAFARQRDPDTRDDGASVPRLVTRHRLSFAVSLMLVLLRGRLADSDATSSDTRLLLSRDDLVDMVRGFLPPRSNEAQLVDQIEIHIKKLCDLKVLRATKQAGWYEVRRHLKTLVDAQVLGDYHDLLATYRDTLDAPKDDV